MGTPEFVVPVFNEIANEHEIVAVFTRAPKPIGRKQILTKSPVHQWAESKSIPVYTTVSSLRSIVENIDYIVVAAYGVILQDWVLNFAPCINIHPSLLPKYRGPAPITSAIRNGDTVSAVCLMKMVLDVDAGDILICERFTIDENHTTADVENGVSEISGKMVLQFLNSPEKFPPYPQIGEPTFTKKITSDDEFIDWSKSAMDIHNQIRSIGGRTKINDIDIKILKTEIVDNKLVILTVQPAGKKPMDWKSFVNGQRGKIEFN